MRENCRAEDPELLPIKKPRAKTVALREDCAWIVKGRRILLEQQTGPRWRGLWKLPALPDQLATGNCQSAFGNRLLPIPKPLTFLIYPFTHHRVHLSVFTASVPARPGPPHQWFLLAELKDVPLAAPHRRAIESLLTGDKPQPANAGL